MLRQLPTALLITLFTLMSFSAQAGIEKGDKTFTISGSFQSSDNEDFTTILASAGLFVSDTMEVQGTGFLIDGGGFTVTAFGGNANLYIPGKDPDLIPYIGGGATLVIIDSDTFSDTSIGFNGQIGIKQFLSENVAMNYQFQILSSSDYDATIASVGITIFLE